MISDDTPGSRTDIGPARQPGSGHHSAPDAVWAAVRDDYLAGMSAPEASHVHGVGLSTLRARAAREGWRREDQPWTPPNRLDPWDEGVELEVSVEGDLDRVEFRQLSYVAARRMMRAVMRGDAAEALRWRRVRLAMDVEEADAMRWSEAQEAMDCHRHNAEQDGRDGSDGIFHAD